MPKGSHAPVLPNSLDDSSRQSWSRRRRMVSTNHVGIKIYVIGPLDRAELTVHGDGLEDHAVITDRSEHAAGLKQPGQIDLVHRAVGERQPNPALSERLNVGDGGTRWIHD